jgi:NADPH-dependent glutamate synthase beta subunit-like oxidoreductase
VVIIGGGDTGCDCIATSLRHVSISWKKEYSRWNKFL